jgi:hypothetical protein
MNQKPASTSFSSKAMNSQPNKPVPNKDESNKFVPPTEKSASFIEFFGNKFYKCNRL